ncbi:MAG: hypothetical protein ACJ703_04905 [Nitrososphaera sp.]
MSVNNSNNTPCLRKNKISALLVLSAAVALVLLASPLLPLSNILQPVQAQTPMTFKTPSPAQSEERNSALTFDAQGTLSTNSSGDQPMNGTFQVTSTPDGGIINSGDIVRGRLSNNSQGVVSIELIGRNDAIATSCSTSANNIILMDESPYRGAVDCDTGDTTAQPSSSSSSSSQMTGATTTSQDGDGDGIPDSSDRCTHNSNPKCFKEATT